MKFKNLLIIGLFLLIGAPMIAQLQIIIPNQYEDKLEGTEQQVSENFFPYSYKGALIDLKSFKKRFPGLVQLPDEVQIQAPSFEGFRDSTALIGFIKESSSDPGQLIILLAGNFNTNTVTFFVDRNLDNNFLNDGSPIVIEAGGEAHNIEFFQDEGVKRKINMQLPDREAFILERLGAKKVKVKGFAIDVHGGVGFGKLHYDYDNLETGFPTWYDVNITEKSIGTSLSYNLSLVTISLSATYQHLFYYTSYLNIRRDNPRLEIDPISGQRRFIDNVDVSRNLDDHSKSKMQLAASLGFRLHVSDYLEFRPFISAGKILHLPDQYIADNRDDQIIYALPSNNFLESGLTMEVATGARRAFYLTIAGNFLDWQPTGFFEATAHENLKTSFRTWKCLFGYRIGF